MTMRSKPAAIGLLFGGLGLVACAAQQKSGAPTRGGQRAADDAAPAQQAYGQPREEPAKASESAGPAQPGYAPAPPPAPAAVAPDASGSSTSNVAISQASNELDVAQRELDVAAGDCRNACRALGSMDRAAGKLCSLTQGNAEARRCDDAKKRVYTNRDRVKSTCGSCADGTSVERSAPVPSTR